MKVLTHERSADHFQLLFVVAVLDVSNAAFNLKSSSVEGLICIQVAQPICYRVYFSE